MAKPKGRSKPKKGSKSAKAAEAPSHEFAAHDIFDGDDEYSHIPKDFNVDNYEYTLPADFQDEEIDSDEAFNSDDEAMYGHMFKSSNKKKNSKPAKASKAAKTAVRGLDILNEDDDDEQEMGEDDDNDDEDDGDGMMLSDILGGSKPTAKQGTSVRQAAVDESDDEDESDIDDEVHNQLLGALSQLDKRRVRAKERNEARPADAAALTTTHKVQLTDLVGSLAAAGSAALGTVKTQMSQLKRASLSLAKPLDRGVREEIERDVVYNSAAKEVSKWMPRVTANRKAEHLSFGEQSAVKQASSTGLVVKFQAETELEKQVQSVLGSSAAVEKADRGLTDAEQLALRSLDPQEAKERRQQLSKLRALESYYEAKCRRAKKIKSKKYRKVQKKAREAQDNKLSLDELADEDDEAAQANLDKAERSRAQERMTLRHKNQGKWAKRMLQRGHMDKESRRAIGDQLSQEQELKRKITMESDEAGDSNDGVDSGSDIEAGGEHAAVLALERDILAGPKQDANVSNAVAGLKFMRQAVDRKRQEAQHELELLKAELTGKPLEEDKTTRHSFDPEQNKKAARPMRQEEGSDDDDDFEDLDAMQALNRMTTRKGTITRVDGAVSINLKAQQADVNSTIDARNDVDSSLDLQLSKAEFASEHAATDSNSVVELAPAVASNDDGLKGLGDEVDNPWLVDVKTTSGLTPAMAMDAFTRKADKRMAKLQRQGKRSQQDMVVAVDVSKADEPSTTSTAVVDTIDLNEEDAGSQDDGQHAQARMNLATGTADQKQLIQEAFAGDNILEEDFAAEKERLTEQSKPKNKDLTLPGWGVWGGENVANPFPKRKVVEKAPPSKKRKDGRLKNVIISEKVDKKLAARQVQQLPHGYRKSAQFERTLAAPLGREWNTDGNFRKGIRGRVETVAGKIIQPMSLSQGVKGEGKRRAVERSKREPESLRKKKKKLAGLA